MKVPSDLVTGNLESSAYSSSHIAEIAVRKFYHCEGIQPPKLILWLQSPHEGAMAADLLARVKCQGPSALGHQLWDLLATHDADAWYMTDAVLEKVRSQVWANAWDMVGRDIGYQLDMSIGIKESNTPSQHYRVWPRLASKRSNEGLSVDEPDKPWDEMIASPCLWESPKAMEVANLFKQDHVLKYQYDLVGSGEAMTHCLDYLASKATQSRPHSCESINSLALTHDARAQALYQIACNCDWIWCFEGACILTERPQFTFQDSAGKLHCEDGPALAYADGTTFYLWHGVQVPQWLIDEPHRITVRAIDDEQNAEVRRIMIDRYGLARYVVRSGFQQVQRLEANHPIVGLRTATLWVKQLADVEPIVYVDVLNSTAEPDGTFKRYMLRVDPLAYGGDSKRFVQAAVASTWRDAEGQLAYPDWREYSPRFES